MVVSVASPDASDFGRGYQWFSVAGITEDNRPARISVAMPEFKKTVVSPTHSVQANRRINAIGGATQLHLFPGLGHGIDARVLQAAGQALR